MLLITRNAKEKLRETLFPTRADGRIFHKLFGEKWIPHTNINVALKYACHLLECVCYYIAC